jgi:hypothetical protein
MTLLRNNHNNARPQAGSKLCSPTGTEFIDASLMAAAAEFRAQNPSATGLACGHVLQIGAGALNAGESRTLSSANSASLCLKGNFAIPRISRKI